MEEELGRHAIKQRGSHIICRYHRGPRCVHAMFTCRLSTSGLRPQKLTPPCCVSKLHSRLVVGSLRMHPGRLLAALGHGSHVFCSDSGAACCHAVRRQGNPLLSGDLLRVSVQCARAIIVVATDASPDVSDARVLRTVLALMGEHDKLQKRLHHGLKVST